jgi:hypothetical protein
MPKQHYGYSSRPNDIQDRVAYAVQATDKSLEKLFSCSTLKADGSNYDEWVAEVKPLLGAAKCLEFNSTGPTAANGDRPSCLKTSPDAVVYKAIGIIHKYVDSTIRQRLHAISTQCATKLWDYLSKEFAGKNLNRRTAAIKIITSASVSLANLDRDVNNFIVIAQKLTTATGSDSLSIQNLAITLLLNALPEALNHVRMPLETSIGSETPFSLADMVSKIIEEGTQILRKRKTYDALAVTASTPSTRPKINWEAEKCIHCNQMGHRSYRYSGCPKHDPSKASRKRAKTSAPSTPTATAMLIDTIDPAVKPPVCPAETICMPHFVDSLNNMALMCEETDQPASQTEVALSLTPDYYQSQRGEVVLTFDSGAYPSYSGNKVILSNFKDQISSAQTASKDSELITTGSGEIELAGLTIPTIYPCG